MPTQALKSLLDRDLSVASASDQIVPATKVLDEAVNYATNLLGRCFASCGSDADTTVCLIFHQLLEALDGVSIHLSKGAPVAARPGIRTAFETLLYLNYIALDQSHYEKRALSYLATEIHARIRLRRQYDSSDQLGKEFRKAFSQDRYARKVTLPKLPDTKVQIKKYETWLKLPSLSPIEVERQRVRKKGNRTPEWFSLFGGPPNRKVLAEKVGFGGVYEFLYREWSRTAHGLDLLRLMQKDPSGQPAVRQLRDPSETVTILSLAMSFLLNAMNIIQAQLRPGEEHIKAKWYMEEIKPDYDILMGKRK